MGEAERRVYDFMYRNAGVISREKAMAMGMSPRTIGRRIDEGRLVAINRRVLGLPGVLLGELPMLRAACATLGAVVSHHSATRLLGMTGLNPELVTVSVPVRRSNRLNGVTVHQSTDLQPEHVVELQELPVTTTARTIVDLAAVLPPKKLADVVDQGVHRKLTTYDEISQLLASLARRGKPGVVKLRSILDQRSSAFVSESVLETRLIELIRTEGLPLPRMQYRPEWLSHVSGRVDLAYPEHRLVIEGDSMKYHGTPEHFQKDRVRDNLAQIAGWRILRFTWEDIETRPIYVVRAITAALDNEPSTLSGAVVLGS